MPQSVKFVDRPGGTVLLDVSPGNSSGIQLGEGGLDAPPPPVVRAVSQNPMLDGSVVTAQPYGMRSVKVPLAYSAGVRATTALEQAARRTAIGTLMRVIQRERFWLEVTADGASEARYLSCYRVSDEKAIAKIAGLGSRWLETNLDILADPFALGPKETLSAQSTTVANDLRTLIAGSGVKGDVPAPLILSYSPAGDTQAKTIWWASRVAGPSPHKCIVDFSTLANGTAPAGTVFTANVANAQALGGTWDTWAITTENASVGATILGGDGPIITTPGGSAGLLQGQYRVFAVIPILSGDNTGTGWRADLRIVPPIGSEITLASVSSVRGPLGANYDRNPSIIDFGVVEVPYGGRAVAPGFDAPATTSPATLRVYLTLTASTSAGTTTRAFDALIVLPADDTMLNLQLFPVAGRTYIIDPHSATVLVQASGVNVGDAAKVQATGVTPFVVPGVDVEVFAFGHRGGLGSFSPTQEDIAHLPVTYTPSYWPRYLMVA